MEYTIVLRILFRLNLVLSITISHTQFVMFNVLCSIPIFYVSTQLVSFIDLNEFYWVLQLDLIICIWRPKYIKSNYPFLIPSNDLYSNVIPFTSTWKILKDAPNHIRMIMVGLAQISRDILKDGDIIIFPLILITPKSLRPSIKPITAPDRYHILHLMHWG